MSDPGRKFWITVLGIVVVSVLPLVRDTAAVGTAISAVGAMVLAFCGANAVVSWGYAKSDATSRSLTGTTDIEARRDAANGWEPTP